MPNIVNLGYRSTNYYAISLAHGRLLVDCGWPDSMSRFLAEFRRKGVEPSEIKYLLATHYHPDHAGLADEFKKRGARLIILESQVAALEPPATHGSGIPPFIKVSPANNIILPFAESRKLLASLGLKGEIVPTPGGHSDDSIALVLDDGSAFTGDLPPRFMITDDNPALKAAWAALDRHRVTRVYPAHGAAVG